MNVFDGLYTVDQSGKIVPNLVVSDATSPDGLTHTINIRRGVKFHDGTELTAADVKFSFERALDPKLIVPSRPDLPAIAGIDAPSRWTVVFRLKAPDPIFKNRLAVPVTYVVPMDYVTRVGNVVFNQRPIGSGPYRFVKAKPGLYTMVEAFNQYWGGAPRIKTVMFLQVPEAATRIALLQAGQVDLIPDVDPAHIPLLEKRTDIKLVGHPTSEILWFSFRQDVAALRDVRVRQALNYGTNRKAIVDTLLRGYGSLLASHVPKGLPGYDPALVPYPYDPEKAKQLLTDARYDFNAVLGLAIPRGRWPGLEDASQAIVDDLGRIGVKVNLVFQDYDQWLRDLVAKRTPAMTIKNASNRSYDWIAPVQVHIGCREPYSNWCEERIDQQLKSAAALSGDSRAAAIRDFMRFLHEYAPGIFLWERQNVIAVRKGLEWTPTTATYVLFRLREATYQLP
jgi:peptide/nickel transport system substrate-binding protein